ncbi:MAG: SAM-dependent methyltransferase [Acidiphilium sp. 20-67-58]|jgi:SAM-dependent methyltransferase|nr:MAG: SAM-dependent methyltransferase [Acidiphilium sp. 20-67-58]
MNLSNGYVTDITYSSGYYVEQSPRLTALVALLTGQDARMPGPDEPFHFLDIGSGRGFTALVMAVANPGWTVTGIDFNRAHVADAREMAARAGIRNCRFIEADLADFDDTDLPAVDAVSLHGVWTWVSDAVRAGILRLLERRLVPGGLCHVSYNLLPGWGGVVGLQRLVREAGLRLADRADRQVERGFGVVRHLFGPLGEATDERTRAMLQMLADKPAAYLAHEFMNADWRPCFHADVAAAFSDVGLSYVGSSRILDSIAEVTLPPAALEVARQFGDSAMTELIKDVTLGRPLRHDIYVRGGRRVAMVPRDSILRGLTLGLALPYSQRRLGIPSPTGELSMNPAFYEPVFARLAQGGASVEELLSLARPNGASPASDNPAELVALLVGTGQAVLLPAPGRPMTASARALNGMMFATQVAGTAMTETVAFAVPAQGGGFNLPAAGALAVLRQQERRETAAEGTILPPPDRDTIERWAAEAMGDRPEMCVALATGMESFLRESRSTLEALGIPC